MVIYCGFWFVCYGGFLGCLYNFLLCMMMMEEYTGVHVYMCPCEEVFMCLCIWRWWMSVHVTESASDLPSSRVFTLTSSVPTSLPPEHRIFNVWQSSSESWSLFWFFDKDWPGEDASNTVWAEVKVTKVAVVPAQPKNYAKYQQTFHIGKFSP